MIATIISIIVLLLLMAFDYFLIRLNSDSYTTVNYNEEEVLKKMACKKGKGGKKR